MHGRHRTCLQASQVAAQPASDVEAAEEQTTEEASADGGVPAGRAIAARVPNVVRETGAQQAKTESRRCADRPRLRARAVPPGARIFVVVVAYDSAETRARRLRQIHDEHDRHHDDVDGQQNVLHPLQPRPIAHLLLLRLVHVLKKTEDHQQSDHLQADREHHLTKRRPRDADLAGAFRPGLAPAAEMLAVSSDQVASGLSQQLLGSHNRVLAVVAVLVVDILRRDSCNSGAPLLRALRSLRLSYRRDSEQFASPRLFLRS